MSGYGKYPPVNGVEQRNVKPVVDCSKDKGMTVQADRDDADINKVIARLEKGASLQRASMRDPFYGDVSAFDGLADALMKVREADRLFMEFDAGIREKFDNDKVKFVEFLEDPKNLDEAVKLGIVQKRPVVGEIHETPPVQPGPSGAPAASGGSPA